MNLFISGGPLKALAGFFSLLTFGCNHHIQFSPKQAPELVTTQVYSVGDLIRVSENGISISGSMPPPQLLTAAQGRHLRFDEGRLYYFGLKDSNLYAIDIAHPHSSKITVITLPPVPDFFPTDPLMHLHRQEDFSIDKNVLCLDLESRSVEPEMIYNIRVNIRTGAYARHLIKADCGVRCDSREIVRPRLCVPEGPPGDGLSVRTGFVAVTPARPRPVR